jgi:hypothetical protein
MSRNFSAPEGPGVRVWAERVRSSVSKAGATTDWEFFSLGVDPFKQENQSFRR